jgi:membrane-associated phospholipid phosphatase
VSPRGRAARTAFGAVALFVLADLVLCRTRIGQRADNAVFSIVLHTIPEAGRRILADLARPALIIGLAALLLLLAVRSALREPKRVALAVAALLSVPLAHEIRSTWTRPDLGVPGYLSNTFPSTHAAAGTALLLGCLALWPRPLGRPEAWGAAGVALVILVGNVAWYAHRPADVLGSALLALAVTAFASALLAEPLLRLAPSVGDSPAPARTGGGANAG